MNNIFNNSIPFKPIYVGRQLREQLQMHFLKIGTPSASFLVEANVPFNN
jgi:hypothetical protein